MKPLFAALACAVLAAPAIPCSAFVVVGDGRILFANNEDYFDPETFVWFTPAKDGRHGAMYLGYANGSPQGGMNDAGLAFDGFATGPHPLTEQQGKEEWRGKGSLLAEVLETCATVDDVVAFFERIDLSRMLERAMLFYADARGDGVIVEGDKLLRKQGDVQAITNFYQSETDDPKAACPRYAAAMRVLEPRGETSVAVCEQALSAAAQRGDRVATLYSNVFDLKARTARLYLFHDYEHAVELDLAAELAKGEHKVALPELFPRNAAFERFFERSDKGVTRRIEARRGPRPSLETVRKLEGEFDLALEGRTVRVTLDRRGRDLEAASEIYAATGGTRRFVSASPTEFFALTADSEQTLRFRVDDDGRAVGFTLVEGDVEREAVRVGG